jgi:hypothetical protein
LVVRSHSRKNQGRTLYLKAEVALIPRARLTLVSGEFPFT